MGEKGIKHVPGSAVTNGPLVKAAEEAHNASKSKVDTSMKANSESGGKGKSASQQTGQKAAKTQKPGVDLKDRFDRAKATSDTGVKQRSVLKRQIGKAEKKAAGAFATSSHAATNRNAAPKAVQRGLDIIRKNSGGVNFIQSSSSRLSLYTGSRSAYRQTVGQMVRAYNVKTVLTSVKSAARKVASRLLGGAISVFLYALDTSELGSGMLPPWRRKYNGAVAGYARTDDSLIAINELRRMNAIIYERQVIDNRSFVLVMAAVGESYRTADTSHAAKILKKYSWMIDNYKKSLLKAADLIDINVQEAERIHREVQTAYSWNAEYMQHVNTYHLPYIRLFKNHAASYRKLSERLRSDTVAASADLSLR